MFKETSKNIFAYENFKNFDSQNENNTYQKLYIEFFGEQSELY